MSDLRDLIARLRQCRSKLCDEAADRLEAPSATERTDDPFSMGPWVGDRSVKFLRQTFDAAADACDGDYPAKVNAGMLACYDSGYRTGKFDAAPSPRVEVAAIKMLADVREFLADSEHGKWPYVEGGHQAEDMAEWVKKLDDFLKGRDMKGERNG